MLSPEGAPVAAPDWFATGRLGPSSMTVLCLSGQPQGPAARLHRQRPAGSAACRGVLVFIEIAGRRVVGLGLPAAFQPAVAVEPMTGERRGCRPALARCRLAADSHHAV